MKRRALLAAPWLLATAPTPALAAPAPVLEPFGRGSWAVLKAAHAGRPLAVHFWGLSCGPCLVELPRWAGLARRHPGLAVVLVHADPPGTEAQVSATLARSGLARLRHLAFADRFAARLRFEVDPGWQGELPRTDLVDAAGQATPVIGPLAPAALAAWLASAGPAGSGATPPAAAPPAGRG